MIKRCGLYFIFSVLFAYLSPASASQDSVDLETILVSKSNIHLKAPFYLNSDSLENLPFASWSEALSLTPLDLQSRSLKADIQTDFSLRGSNYQGVLLLIDGQRVNDPKLGHYNCDLALTREDIERIEVIPGVGSSVFGPDAVGGAINIITKRPEEKKRILESSFGSHQTKSGILSITERKDNLGVRFNLEREESNGFHYDTDFKKFTTTLMSSLDIPDGKFNFDLGYLEKEFGAYDFYTPGRGYPSKEWIKAYQLNTGLNLEKQGFIIKPNFLWRRHYDKFMLDKNNPGLSLNHHRSDAYTPNIYFQKQSEVLGRVGLGLEYGQERVNSTALGKHDRDHKSIFIDESKDLTPALSVGLSFRTDDYQGFDQAYTGSLNFRHKLFESNSLRLGISRSIRIPTFHELYYSDPTTVGNSALSCEESLDYEIGIEHNKDKLSLGSTFFLRREDDSIDWVKRTSAQAKWQAENITKADVFGIENYLRLRITQNISLNSNYTYINKRTDDSGYIYKYGENYARHIFNSVFSLNLPFGVQIIAMTYKKKPGRNGWFLLNTRFSYDLNKASEIFLRISNLLNVGYQEIEGIPQPGRWFEAGLRLDW